MVPDTYRLVEVADVEVEVTIIRLVMVEEAELTRMPAFRVWRAVHVLALPRFKDATTAPVVGEMVSVPLELETEEMAPERHVPLTATHPAVTLSPLANVEDAAVEVMLSRFAASPPVKVEVEVTAPDTLRNPCRVEVPVVDP